MTMIVAHLMKCFTTTFSCTLGVCFARTSVKQPM